MNHSCCSISVRHLAEHLFTVFTVAELGIVEEALFFSLLYFFS